MKLILFIIFLLSTNVFSQFAPWQYYGDMNRPVAGADIWESENKDYLFILGGYSDSLQANVNWIQDFQQPSFLDSMSIPRFGLVTENYNGQVIFFGGVSDVLSSTTGIERWNIDFNAENIFAININFNRIFSTAHVIDDMFYIIGGNPQPGTTADTLSYIIEYSIQDSQITYQLDSLYLTGEFPEQQMSAIIDDDIYIFGGTSNGVSQDIYKFNTITKVYEKLPIELLTPRAGGRAVKSIIDNRIYIIGGYNEVDDALNSVEVFEIFNQEYYVYEGEPIIEGRYNFMIGILQDSIFILGGFDKDGNVLSSIEYLYEYEVTVMADEKNSSIGESYKLHQNYPNPFNPATSINYTIPSSSVSSSVSITVYDIIGNEVDIIVNKDHTPGNYSIQFDASNLPSGIYYYQFRSNSFIQTKKMILLK